MRDATPAGPARPGASQTRGTEAEDTITVAPEGEENGVGTQRRIRKPSAKARENGIVQDPLDAALLAEKQNGNTARGATANDMQTKTPCATARPDGASTLDGRTSVSAELMVAELCIAVLISGK
jgi:hypothetical protein